jgi:tetratricopeptide (TPR) repeat protein
LDKALVLRRIAESFRDGPALDAQLAALRRGAETNPDRCAALVELADFLLAHRNALEAIPDLAAVAHNETCADPQRVKAWVALARAHLWVGEPEKARVEAENLIASLGAHLPEARAGGKLILGIQDANLKRPALARQDFKEAMVLAPGTPYAKEAADMIEDLRKGWTMK